MTEFTETVCRTKNIFCMKQFLKVIRMRRDKQPAVSWEYTALLVSLFEKMKSKIIHAFSIETANVWPKVYHESEVTFSI